MNRQGQNFSGVESMETCLVCGTSEEDFKGPLFFSMEGLDAIMYLLYGLSAREVSEK